MALAAADTYVVVLALTDMMRGVGLGIDSLQRATPIVSGFLLGYVAVLPLVGRLADLVDRRRVLLGCLAVFVVGSCVTALSVELPVLVAGRVVQGVGGGGLVPATLALVADLWPAGRRGLPLGVVGAVQEVGSVLGPVLGAAVLAVADWRAIFWLGAAAGVVLAGAVVVTGGGGLRRPRPVPVGLGALAAAATWVTLAAPDRLTTSVRLGLPFVPFGSSGSRVLTPAGVVAGVLVVAALAVALRGRWAAARRVDLLGALLVGGALGCLVLTFATARPEREVVGPLGYVLLPVAALLVGAYVLHHRRAATPLLPRGLVRGRLVRALVVSLLTGVVLVALVVDVPLLARIVLTTDETEAALVLVRFLVAVPVGALAGGWLLRHRAPGAVAAAGLGTAAVGLQVLAGDPTARPLDSWPFALVLVVTGLGLGLVLAPVNDAALAESAEDTHGAASSLVVVARMVGMVVGLALLTAVGLHRYYLAVGALPDPGDADALRAAAVVQVSSVFRGAQVAAVVGAVVALGLGREVRRPDATVPEGSAVAGRG